VDKNIIFLTGITGQVGSYMAEYLLSKNYEVHGIIRRISSFSTGRIDHIFDKLHLHYGDMTDSNSIVNLINNIEPNYIFDFAAQSHVKVSYDIPEYTGNSTGLGFLRLIEAVKNNKKLINTTKIYHSSTSELYGDSLPPQNEETLMLPNSPYAIAKLYAHWIGKSYRKAYEMFISNGIIFNTESPRRLETFVTQKIIKFITSLLLGKKEILKLGNLYAKRDWGFAPEYVKMIYVILQQDKPNDFVIGTGESHSIKEFLIEAFDYIGLSIKFEGEGKEEIGYINNNQKIIEIDEKYYRPNEVNWLEADITKSKKELNWKPKIKFKELIKIMIDYALIKNNLPPIGEGIKIIKNNDFNWSSVL